MGGTAAQLGHDNGGEGGCFGEQHVIRGHQQLLGVQTEQIGYILQDVDGGTVQSGLAGLAQTAIADGNAEAF